MLDARTGDFLKQSQPFVGLGGELSADGNHFLVAENHDAKMDLARIDLTTGKLERLTDFGEFESLGTPTWSPNGQRIAERRRPLLWSP